MDNNIAEGDHRTPVVGRKNFYGSGSLWSGQLAAARTWLLAYLQACCDASNRAAADAHAFLWTMTPGELAAMRACPVATLPTVEGLDTS